ncbi:MAG: hypothetical protein AB1507_00905 [Bacillota bacterium]|nr:hypothetical protein [Thermoanaerobacteraceae bacterium]
MRQFAALILLALTAVFLAGCWDLEEVEDLGFVTAVAVNTAPRSEIELLVQVINPRVIAGGFRGAITPGASISAK